LSQKLLNPASDKEVRGRNRSIYNERTNRLIDGHARRKIAPEQGCRRVPVLVGSWDEVTEAKILATLDPISPMAEADSVKLEALLREVSTDSDLRIGPALVLSAGPLC
jgi:ParB-like chromosome segregation protein Spo0J